MLKKIVQAALQPFGLRIVRWRNTYLSGQYLFADLAKVLGTSSPVCMDVGANKGQTIDALMDTFDHPVIHAFEPAAATFQKLAARSFPANVHLYQLGMGAREDQREFLNYEDPLLSSFLRPSAANSNPFLGVKISGTETVAVETVDEFLARNSIDALDLLKIDTQGFDLEVLRGAGKSLQAGAVRTVMIEVNFMPLYEGQPAPTEILAFLEAQGFGLVDLYEKEMKGNRMAWCTALFARA